MAVSINNIPKLAFTQNEVKVQLTSDNYLESEGAKGVYRLSFNPDGAPAGQTLWFTLRNKRFLYGTDGSSGGLAIQGYSFPVYSETYNLAYYMSLALSALNAGYELNSDFIISQDGEDIVFTARNYGSEISVLLESVFWTLTEETAPTDRVVREGFNHYVQLWTSDLATRLFESNIPLDYPETGVSAFDISSVLHSLVSLDIPQMDVFFQRCPNSVFSYIIKYGNRFGESQNIKELKQTPVRYAFLGGYSMMALLNIDVDSYLQNYLLRTPEEFEKQNWFESYPQDNLLVKTNQPMFLYFVNSRSISENIRIRIKATLQDGSQILRIRDGGIVMPYEKVCIGCGYKQVGAFQMNVRKNLVDKYEITLVGDDESPRTVSKTFLVDRNFESFTRYFLYAGSDGNFKTIKTYGSAQGFVDFERDTRRSINAQSERKVMGDIQTFDVLCNESEILNTGYISSRNKVNLLKELLISKKVFRIIGSKMVPVIFKTTNVELYRENSGAGAMKIEYRLAWDDHLFTGDTWALNVPVINQSQQALNDL